MKSSLAMNRRQCRLFALHLLSLFTVILALGVAASAEWKDRVLYSFEGSPDAATPQGGVVFDKQGNLYGAALGGPQYSQGTVFQVAPPAKKGDSWTEAVLYVFQGKPVNDGQIPTGGLVIDSAGNLYGVTGYGGTGDCILLGIPLGCGTAYEMSPPKEIGGKWTETILHSFQGGKDGYFPNGTLVFDSAGNLYGATDYGGGYGRCNALYYQYCGTIFELSPPTTKGGKWTEKVLYAFKSGRDGANPNGELVFDGKGAIYGTTYAGGNQNCKTDASIGCGTVFELKPPTKEGGIWAEKPLHIFTGGIDGGQPSAGLVFDTKGALYGVAGGGNISGGGIAFRLTVVNGERWKETVLHWFSNSGGGPPLASLILDSVGNLYGTTIGGDRSPDGTVFRLLPPTEHGAAWKETELYVFAGSPDGRHPTAGLVSDKLGDLYGTTLWGGMSESCQGGCGTVFKVSP
jgi:hypothetical protein